MPRSRSTSTASAAPAERTTGRELHERVTTLIAANPGMTQAAAFAQVAEAEGGGRTPANVAANYYRVQRQQGGGNSGRRTTRARNGGRARSASQITETERMLDRIERDVRDALDGLAAARAGLAEARDASARVEAVRRALA